MVASPHLAWEYLVRISAHLLIVYKENKHLGIELNLSWLLSETNLNSIVKT